MLSYAQLRCSLHKVCRAPGPPKRGGRPPRDGMPLLPHSDGERLVAHKRRARGPRKPPCRHQSLCGAVKDGSRQTKACGERPSRDSDRGQGGSLISRPGNGPREAWFGFEDATLSACSKAIRNLRSVEAYARRRPQSSRKAQPGTDGSQGAAFLSVWLTGRLTIPVAAACGRARGYSDRSRR